MGTVVLMGYSTSGKSTILRKLALRSGRCLKTVDTDKLIANDYGGHIYNVYLRLTKGPNRQAALHYVRKKETRLVNALVPMNTPRLIAAGPALPSRDPEWNLFVERVKPVCFYLEMTAQEVYKGLHRRRSGHLKCVEIRDDPSFGCWDEGTTTKYEDGRWVPVSEQDAMANIEQEMSPSVKIYERYCNGGKISARKIRGSTEVAEKFYRQIEESLGL